VVKFPSEKLGGNVGTQGLYEGGRLTLIKSTLSSIAHFLFLFPIPFSIAK
jgi:hypothetical protein